MGLSIRALALFPIASVLALSFAISCSSAYGEADADAGSAAESGADAGPTLDAPADAPVADAFVRFCVGAEALFCEDYDEGPLGQKWTSIATSEAGTLELVSSTKSPPNALLATVRGQSGVEGLSGQATLVKNLARDNLPGVALDLDLRIDQVPTDASAIAVIASISFDFDKYAVNLLALPNGLGLLISDPSLDGGVSNTIVQRPLGTEFFHVRIEASFVGTGTKVLVDGVPTRVAEGLTPMAGGFYVVIGAILVRTTEETKVAYDNVVITGL